MSSPQGAPTQPALLALVGSLIRQTIGLESDFYLLRPQYLPGEMEIDQKNAPKFAAAGFGDEYPFHPINNELDRIQAILRDGGSSFTTEELRVAQQELRASQDTINAMTTSLVQLRQALEGRGHQYPEGFRFRVIGNQGDVG